MTKEIYSAKIIGMRSYLEKNLISLAKSLSAPLYVVGGAVRNFLIDKSYSEDIDLASSVKTEELTEKLTEFGFSIIAEYKRTGTIVFKGQDRKYEFTTFRKEKYAVGGLHTPIETEFTDDIMLDAKRRDFKCNAIYYDIVKGKIVDVLGGVKDVKKRVLDTVDTPEKVFCSDGLRLMRLARFAGELNFKPTLEVMGSATKYASNIKDISPERIYVELVRILHSDRKYPFSDKEGHYTGLKILDYTRVLDYIFPELTEGRGMVQRADFHKYDVLEHSLRAVLHSNPSVRLASLLHDVAKPYCFKRDGMYYKHDVEGERLAENILMRLKADKTTVKKVKFLVKAHMVDLDCSMREQKVRLFMAKNFDMLKELLYIKQADFRASLEDDSTAPTLIKWGKIYWDMCKNGQPFSLKELKITAEDLIGIGYSGESIGKELKKLFEFAVVTDGANEKERLLKIAKADFVG